MNFSLELYIYKNFEKLNNRIKLKNYFFFLKEDFLTLTTSTIYKIIYNLNIIKHIFKLNNKIYPHIIFNNNINNFLNLIYLYFLININNIILLKGDLIISNKYNSYNFSNLIKKNFKFFFNIYLSIYPDIYNKSFNYLNELKINLIKYNLNCNKFITQYFYNIEYYFDLISNIYKLYNNKNNNILIIPGIIIINSLKNLLRFTNFCKSELNFLFLFKFNNFYINDNIFLKNNFNFLINICFKIYFLKINKKTHFYILNDFINFYKIYNIFFYNLNV